MLIHNTQPRPDLNDGEKHEPRRVTALHVLLALRAVRAGNPIKTLRVKR